MNGSRAIGLGALAASLALALGACGAATPAPPSPSPASPAPSAAASQSPASPVASPVLEDGDAWLAFQTTGPAGYGIYLARPDGTGFHTPLAGVGSGTQLHPDWSPDGSTLIFDIGESGDIWQVQVEGWAPERLLECSAPCVGAGEAAWSRDGRSIASHRETDPDGDGIPTSTLEVIDVATRDTRVVLTAPAGQVVLAPRWSTDDRSIVVEVIAVAAPTAGSSDLQVTGGSIGVVDLAAATLEIRTIVPFETFANNPDWSPTDDLIVFSAPAEGGEPGGAKSDLWTMKPDGSGLTRLTDVAAAGGMAIHPAFAPDGEQVLFVLTDAASGAFDAMAMVGLDGTGVAPATTSGFTPGTHPRLRPTP
jgi:Tol biopolymer transport system component